LNTFIALFRGINVGGRNKLPMRELVEILDRLGLEKIETYIQSRNVVFESEENNASTIAQKVQDAIKEKYNFAPQVILLRPKELKDAIESNPFPNAEIKPKTLHIYFLDLEPQKPDLDKLKSIKEDNESFVLKNKVFYLHAPDGIGRSKLAASVEKALGVTTTARNWRTVAKIMAMANR